MELAFSGSLLVLAGVSLINKFISPNMSYHAHPTWTPTPHPQCDAQLWRLRDQFYHATVHRLWLWLCDATDLFIYPWSQPMIPCMNSPKNAPNHPPHSQLPSLIDTILRKCEHRPKKQNIKYAISNAQWYFEPPKTICYLRKHIQHHHPYTALKIQSSTAKHTNLTSPDSPQFFIHKNHIQKKRSRRISVFPWPKGEVLFMRFVSGSSKPWFCCRWNWDIIPRSGYDGTFAWYINKKLNACLNIFAILQND